MRRAEKVQPFGGAVAISLDGAWIYAANSGRAKGALYVYNAQSGKLAAKVPGFNCARQLYVAPTSGDVFVAEYGANCVRQLRGMTLRDAVRLRRCTTSCNALEDVVPGKPFARINRPVGVCVGTDAVFVAGSESAVDTLPCRATSDSIIAVYNPDTGELLHYLRTRPHAFSGALCQYGDAWCIAMAGSDMQVAFFDMSLTFYDVFSRAPGALEAPGAPGAPAYPSVSFAPCTLTASTVSSTPSAGAARTRAATPALLAPWRDLLMCKTFSIAFVPGYNVILAAYGQTSSVAVFRAATGEVLGVADVSRVLTRVHNVAVNTAKGIVVLQNFDDGRMVRMQLSKLLSDACGTASASTPASKSTSAAEMCSFDMYVDAEPGSAVDAGAGSGAGSGSGSVLTLTMGLGARRNARRSALHK